MPKTRSNPAKTVGSVGRPSLYTDAIAQEICDRIAEGESLRQICECKHVPSMWSVFRWLKDDPDFASKYAHAREMQGDLMDEKILSVADKCTNETAQADRVKLDAYKWRASKLAPKKYGDKMALTGGSEGDAAIRIEDVSDRERAKAMALLVAKQRNSQ